MPYDYAEENVAYERVTGDKSRRPRRTVEDEIALVRARLAQAEKERDEARAKLKAVEKAIAMLKSEALADGMEWSSRQARRLCPTNKKHTAGISETVARIEAALSGESVEAKG